MRRLLAVGASSRAAHGGAGRARHERARPGQAAQARQRTWPTFNGDYSGRRFSTLAHINAANVKALSLAWLYTIATNAGADQVDAAA